jgi:hypothetical protein
MLVTFSQNRLRFRVTNLFVGVDFIIVIVEFYKIQTIRLKVTCQLSSLLGAKERNSVSCSILAPLQSTNF